MGSLPPPPPPPPLSPRLPRLLPPLALLPALPALPAPAPTPAPTPAPAGASLDPVLLLLLLRSAAATAMPAPASAGTTASPQPPPPLPPPAAGMEAEPRSRARSPVAPFALPLPTLSVAPALPSLAALPPPQPHPEFHPSPPPPQPPLCPLPLLLLLPTPLPGRLAASLRCSPVVLALVLLQFLVWPMRPLPPPTGLPACLQVPGCLLSMPAVPTGLDSAVLAPPAPEPAPPAPKTALDAAPPRSISACCFCCCFFFFLTPYTPAPWTTSTSMSVTLPQAPNAWRSLADSSSARKTPFLAGASTSKIKNNKHAKSNRSPKKKNGARSEVDFGFYAKKPYTMHARAVSYACAVVNVPWAADPEPVQRQSPHHHGVREVVGFAVPPGPGLAAWWHHIHVPGRPRILLRVLPVSRQGVSLEVRRLPVNGSPGARARTSCGASAWWAHVQVA